MSKKQPSRAGIPEEDYQYCEQCCNFERKYASMDGYARCKVTNMDTWSEACCEGCRFFNIPAADVQEVRHGEWAINQDDLYWGNFLKRRYCSVCDKPPFYDRKKGEFVLTDYCPNCGAKMDGKGNA